jgi:hypothetical protein
VILAFRFSVDVFPLFFLPPRNAFQPFLQVNFMSSLHLLAGEVLGEFRASFSKYEEEFKLWVRQSFGKFHFQASFTLVTHFRIDLTRLRNTRRSWPGLTTLGTHTIVEGTTLEES